MKAYAHKSIPAHWVLDNGDRAYLVPAIPLGWSKRSLLADKALINYAERVDITHLGWIGLPLTPFAKWLDEMGDIRGYGHPMSKKEGAGLLGISQDTATKYAMKKVLPRTVSLAMAAVKAGLPAFAFSV